MKHSKVIAAVATAGGLLAMSSAHAIAPAAAAAVAGLAGAVVGAAAAQAGQPPPAVVQPAPVAVVPNTVVMGAGPAVVQEVIPAPRAGYRWQQGHYEAQNGVTMYVPGHWVPEAVVIYQN